MDSLEPPLLQPSSDLVMQLHDNLHGTGINGMLPNGNENVFVDPRVLISTEDVEIAYDDLEAEDEMDSSSSEDTKIIATPRQAYLPTGCCYDDRMKLHATGDFSDNTPHPEDPRRIEAIMRIFKEAGLLYTGSPEDADRILKESPTKYMLRIPARVASKDEICTVHYAGHFEWVESLAKKTSEDLRELNKIMDAGRKSLYVGLCTFEAALISAGGAIETCKNVVEGHVKNAIAVIRPPGHHAEANESLGFCVFNNVPVAAKICMLDYPKLCRKVLILDWDIHHGNGTQNMFYEDPNVLYISLHVYENGNFYPGQPDDPDLPDGGIDKVGTGAGIGKNVNIGWPSQGMGDGEYMAAFQKIVMPIAQEFDPDLVIISAGFDAAAGDELGGCFVTPGCYSHMTHMLMSLAGGKVAVCLEGGYNLKAISRSALAVAKTLMGEPPIRQPIPPLNRVAAEVFEEVKYYQSPYWECMRSGVIDYKEAKFKGAIRLDDIVRNYQSNVLSKNYQMVSLWVQRHQLARSFDHQVMVTPYIKSATKILLIVHDPPELLATPDPLTAKVELHNSYLVDPVTEYIGWAIENKIGVMDINIPLNTEIFPPATGGYHPRSGIFELESQIQDLVGYIWDNFIQLYDSDNIILMGVGDSYLGIKQLLTTRDCRPRIAGVLAFITGSLRPVKSETDSTLSSWYKSNSEIYVADKHACWNDEESIRKVRKQRFGNVVRSEETGLVKMLQRHQSSAKSWMLGKFEEKAKDDEVMTMEDEISVTDVDGAKKLATGDMQLM
ncbi:7497f604-a3dc-42be-a176-7ed16bdd1e0e-CDS [Sclerotinia trifoliorum]|uniref:Histone deacetylase n=1 Tax=Sclerotinia trifoliorum TaxID=28548 RepID=A0A8H2W328_9HELO|nr:7497f604-a3dc-42be-a176-7ed16bdd1e0e-CDS [Sclerotinia trifoliorum]